MPTLMIMDDEETIRVGLARIIQRLAPQWDIIAELEDGQEALLKLQDIQPDLIIIDIFMPGIDGLELSKILLERYPLIHKIILTGHNKFSYVQTAMRSGVIDYLLKPIQRNELVEALSKAEEMIMQRKNNAEVGLKYKQLFLEQAVIKLLSGEAADALELQKELQKTGWIFAGAELAVLVTLWSSIEENPGASLMESLQADLKMEFPQIIESFGFFIAKQQYMLCFLGNELPLEQVAAYWLKQEALLNSSSYAQEASLATGISEPFRQLNFLPEAFRQAMFAAFVQDGEPGQPLAALEDSYKADREKLLIAAIETNDFAGAKVLLQQWSLDLNKASQRNASLLQFHFFHFFSFILGTVLGKINTKLSLCIQHEIPWLLSRISLPFTNSSLVRTMQNFVEKLDLQSLEQRKETRKVIEDIKAYIALHYADPNLRLDAIAKLVYLNNNYLSDLFKQVAGVNFVDYLTDVRMSAAKKMLRETNLKSYEIAVLSGYTSAKYFSFLFRRLFGLTPTEYRNRAL